MDSVCVFIFVVFVFVRIFCCVYILYLFYNSVKETNLHNLHGLWCNNLLHVYFVI